MKFSLVLFGYIISLNDANNQTKDKVHTDKLPEDIINTGKCCINFGVKEVISSILPKNSIGLQGRRERGGRVGRQPPTISWSKFFFPRKIGKQKIFVCEENVRLVYLLNKT